MKTFRITAPFVCIEEVELLKRAGVDELYCGYVDEESERSWPIAFHIINRRGEGQSFGDFVTFKAAVKEATKYRLSVYVTMNGLYTPEQYPWLIKTIKKISKLKGVKGLIVADIGLLLTLRKTKYEKEIHISTGATTFNHYTADFFGSLGANRIILDRQLTAKEMVDLISQCKSKINIEIFIFQIACLFIDGYCTFLHCLERNRIDELKKSDFFIRKYSIDQFRRGCDLFQHWLRNKAINTFGILDKNKQIEYQVQKYPFGCNICSLYELKSFPGMTLKILERGMRQAYAVRMISKLIDYLAHKNISRREYQKKAKELYFKINKQRCSPFKCYCPPSLINEG